MIQSRVLFEKYGIHIFLGLLIVTACFISPAFMKYRNINNVLDECAALGMVGLGQTFVILSGGGGIDLSVASIMATVAVVTSKYTAGQNASLLPVGLVCCLFGVVVGLGNGLLITKRRVPPVMATLGMMIIVQGIRFLFTKGAPTGDFPPFLSFLGKGDIGPIPVSILSLAVMTVIAAIVLKKTVMGRQIYAVGGNIDAARLAGYNTNLIVTVVYMISGLTAAIGGLYLAGWLAITDNWVGKGYEIDSIAVVVMGGTSFEGGRGGVFGTIAGVLILAILYNLVILLGLPVNIQHIIKGSVIVLAASFYVTRGVR